MGESTMEKYRDWTDLGTGVNPFVPPYKSQTFGIRMFSYTLGIPIAILKLLTFTLLFVVLGLSSILMAVVGVIPVLGRMVQRLTDKCLARAMLVMLGVFVIQEKKLGPPKPTKNGTINAGDVLICNYTSYADVLYLIQAWSPVFATVSVPLSGSGELQIASMGGFRALLHSLSHSSPSSGSGKSLKEVAASAKRNGQVVVLFAEQVRTNGISVIQFAEHMGPAVTAVDGNVHAVAFVHGQKRNSLPFTAGRAMVHMFKIMMQPWQTMLVKTIPANQLSAKPDSEGAAAEWLEKVRKDLAKHVGVRPVPVPPSRKSSFLVFYDTGVKE